MVDLKSILLVEDDPKDVELTLIALSECNLANEIEVTRDGAEALDYLYRRGAYANRPEQNPVVILLDLKMPKVDGIQVLKTLKSDRQMSSIPVVILTSSREPSDLDECYKLGVNSFVVKPVHFAEFTKVVKEVGMFWAIINEPPPGSMSRKLPDQKQASE
jgi:CheY-like chemotaxis protein